MHHLAMVVSLSTTGICLQRKADLNTCSVTLLQQLCFCHKAVSSGVFANFM